MLLIFLLLVCWSAASSAGYVGLRDGKINFVTEETYQFARGLSWCRELGGEGLSHVTREDLSHLSGIYQSVPQNFRRSPTFWVNAVYQTHADHAQDGYYWRGSEDRVDDSLWGPHEPSCRTSSSCAVAFGNIEGELMLYAEAQNRKKRAFCVFDTRSSSSMKQLRDNLDLVFSKEDRTGLRAILDSL